MYHLCGARRACVLFLPGGGGGGGLVLFFCGCCCGFMVGLGVNVSKVGVYGLQKNAVIFVSI